MCSQAKLSSGVQDPAEYFRPPRGLLSFDMHLHDLVEQSAPHQQVLHSVNHSQAEPRQRTMKLDQDKMGHFNLVNAQIQQVSDHLHYPVTCQWSSPSSKEMESKGRLTVSRLVMLSARLLFRP